VDFGIAETAGNSWLQQLVLPMHIATTIATMPQQLTKLVVAIRFRTRKMPAKIIPVMNDAWGKTWLN
jgi:hypothetical protein